MAVDVHINGIESFWSMLKRAHKETYHKISAKYLGRYVGEFAGCQKNREFDTTDQMAAHSGGVRRVPIDESGFEKRRGWPIALV